MDDRDRNHLFEEAMHLPATERERLADDLYNSLPPSTRHIPQEWIDEAERRVDEYRSGKAKLIDPQETFARTSALIAGAKSQR